jgi:competence protein ComEC
VTEIDGKISKPIVRVWFMDVGNGDCTVIIDEETRCALVIDCPSKYATDVSELLTRERASLDTCVVTHWDADHYAGVARLAVALPVKRVLYNHDTLFASAESPPYAVIGALKEFLDVANPAVTLRPALVGAEGAVGRVGWKLLAPSYYELTRGYVAQRRNVASAVLEVSAPSVRIIIGGDAVAATWQRLLGGELRADILRWPHHGADLSGDASGSIAKALLAAINPSYVIVSAGSGNPHGHPSATVISEARSRAMILCSQVTSGCFGFVSRSARSSDSARDVLTSLVSRSCAGTVEVQCFENMYRVFPEDAEHQMRVELWPQPMCRCRSDASDGGRMAEVVSGTASDPLS